MNGAVAKVVLTGFGRIRTRDFQNRAPRPYPSDHRFNRGDYAESDFNYGSNRLFYTKP